MCHENEIPNKVENIEDEDKSDRCEVQGPRGEMNEVFLRFQRHIDCKHYTPGDPLICLKK